MISAEITKMRNNPEYKNFYAVGNAFNYLCEGLRPYVERKMKDFHVLMLNKTSGTVCTCLFVLNQPNPHTYVKKSCIWAKQLGKFHCIKKKSRIPWHQSDSTKWHDPVLGYWEVAKLFMSDLGNDKGKVKDPSSTDSAGLLNLLYSCSYFHVQQDPIRHVRDWRNTLAHSPKQLLNDSQMNSAIDKILQLLDDPELMACKEVQDRRKTIEDLRRTDFSIVSETELQIWKEFNKSALHYEKIKEKKKKAKERKQKEKEENSAHTSTNLQREQPEKNTKAGNTFHTLVFFFIVLLCGQLHNLIRNTSKYFWCFFLMLTFVKVGDKATLHSNKGCFRATVKSPIAHFGIPEFNFSSYLNYKRNNFFGRKWLFQELDEIYVNGSGPLGVLITGEPGSGKSALMSELICSPHSSLLIHNNIIGYHMCDYSEKGKRDGARFVQNLVVQIAGSIPEYSEFVTNNEQVRKELEKHCISDPVGCFHSTIIGPLRELKNQPGDLQYIFIDALDECLEEDQKSSAILDILKNKLSLFPDWLKIILSSRNWTAVTDKLPQTVKRMALDPTDERNLEDIHFYITHFLFQNSFFMDRLLEAMGLTSTSEGIHSLIDEMSRNGEGNFLFVKTTLEYLNATEGRVNLQSFPTSLYDTYDIYFERQFAKDEFSNYKVLFEVLLAASSPMKSTAIESILKYPTRVFSVLLQKISSFLRFGQDSTVSIYHQSFAEWLVKKTDNTGLHYINKSRGHQSIADYILNIIEKNNATPPLHDLTDLAVHVSLGGMVEKQLTRMKRINISNIRHFCCGHSILHDLALKNNTASILDVFIKMFKSADVPDSIGWTPAFYAAVKGNVENMKVLIKNGIDLNYILDQIPEPTQHSLDTIMQKMRLGFNGHSIVHIAAEYGNINIVRLLIKNGASFEKTNPAGLTPLHLAVQNGHLAIVKQLYQYGAKADIVALHHAVVRNHTKVVKFLMNHDESLEDKCLPCKPASISDFGVNTTVQDIHSAFCETALHAAVSRGHVHIVKLLISFSRSTLDCKHHSGKTPLMDAAERNDTKMVELLLLAGADVNAECGARSLSLENSCLLPYKEDQFLYTMYCKTETDYCSCGKRAIHVCGEYGLWKMAKKLIFEWHANMLAEDCRGWIAPQFSVWNDHADFIENFNHTLSKLLGRMIRNEAYFHLSTLCGSNSILRLLFHNRNTDVLGEIDEHGKTSLHYVAGWSPYSNTAGLLKRYCIHTIVNNSPDFLRKESKKRLTTIKFLTELQKNVSWFVNLQDRSGRSALHYAALGGFSDAVKYLVHQGGDWRIKDQEGNTPLILALAAAPKDPKIIHPYRMTTETIKLWNTTSYDETVAYLIWQERSNIQKCDQKSVQIFYTVLKKRMPLSLYKLLKTGVDVNCDFNGQYMRPFLYHFTIGDKQINEILKIFKVNVTLKCNIPFHQSELHLLSFFGAFDNIGNFFISSFNGQSLPLQRLASANPESLKIFDECHDVEGYLAIHRAAQGGNLDAINWYIRSGVNLSKKTTSGLTALDISVFALNTRFQPVFLGWQFQHDEIIPVARSHIISERQRQLCFEKLLLESWKTSKHKGYSSWCDSKLKRLSPLHFAALSGVEMFEYVYKKAVEVIPALPYNCTNKHNLVPLYLSKLYEQSRLWLQDRNRKDSLPYPDREAEYHIIYNYFYKSPMVNINNFRNKMNGAANCSGFRDFLPKSDFLRQKMKQCYTDCWILASYVYNYSSNHLPFIVDEDCRKYDEWSRKIALMSKLQYFSGMYNFSPFFKREITNAIKCSQECHCTEIKRVLQREFTSQFRMGRIVNKFTAQRMGWKDTSVDGDVRDRWPFYFFVKKARNEYKYYQYLKTLNSNTAAMDIEARSISIYPSFNYFDDNKYDDD